MIDKEPDYKDMQALWDTVADFIENHRITCPESLYQQDKIYHIAPQFIEALCDEVGYFEYPEEEDLLDEEPLCSACNGTGEGQYDGSRCYSCKGSGVERRERD
jgi:hypothetical protein